MLHLTTKIRWTSPILAVVLATGLLFGCNAAKKVQEDKEVAVPPSPSPRRPAPVKRGPSKAEMQARAARKAPGFGMELFSKMDAALYEGEPAKYGDVVMDQRSTRSGMDPVVFSHRIHRAKYTCRVCHLELDFSMKKGESDITRDDCMDGLYCGTCHNGKIAFEVTRKQNCGRCHIPVDSSGGYVSKKAILPDADKQDYGDGINWVETLEDGIISPKTSMTEGNNPSNMPLPEHLQNERMRWTAKTPEYPVSVPVWFPHAAHVKWLDCANCHPDIFMVKKNGTESFDKEKILQGKYCGTCHLNVAFPLNGCRRCHPNRGKSDD